MDKLECLKSNDIGQSAAKPWIEECSQTIPEGSTPKLLGGNGDDFYKVNIYGLIDPQTNLIRYVGKTKYKLEQRLAKHLCAKDKSYRTNWIKSLLNKNLMPKIVLLEECNNRNWIEREKFWILQFNNLVNLTEGGESGIISPQCRAAQLAAVTGRKHTSEEIAKRIKHTSKPVLQYDKQMNLLNEYPSASEAARRVNGQCSIITEVCNFKPKHKTHKGFIWRYKNQDIVGSV